MNKKEEIFRFLVLFLWTFLGDFILLLTTPVEANAMWDDKLTIEVKRAIFCQQPMQLILMFQMTMF